MSSRYTEKFGFTKSPGNILSTASGSSSILQQPADLDRQEHSAPQAQDGMTMYASTANNIEGGTGAYQADRTALQSRSVSSAIQDDSDSRSSTGSPLTKINDTDVLSKSAPNDDILVSPVYSGGGSERYASGMKEFPSVETNHRHISFDFHNQNPHQGNSHSIAMHSRSRSRSFNETSQEALKQLAPPVSVPLVLCCLGWYATSAMSNTLNKTILTHFPYPVTLSMVQFILAAFFGVLLLISASESRKVSRLLPKGLVTSSGLRTPTREILAATAPMGLFQLTGHIMSHMSTQLIPLSLVHTIKALSPLFTVSAYRILFRVKYNPSTYLSLVPLTIGVIMTCSSELSANLAGYIYALVSTLIFVSQNMFAKRLLTHGRIRGTDAGSFSTGKSSSTSLMTPEEPRLDKLNVLCYCSSLAFIFTSPLWFFSEGLTIFSDYRNSQGAYFGGHHVTEGITAMDDYNGTQLLGLFISNGVVHFMQNLLAFQVLGMVSPVTYSVASLIKRIVVITVAIFWFSQSVSTIQGWGILLTFIGLYLYDRCGGDKHHQVEVKKTDVLPR